MSDDDGTIPVNGVDAASGGYVADPPSVSAIASLALDGPVPAPDAAQARARVRDRSEAVLGVREGVDPHDLAQAGWGVVLAPDLDPAVVEALRPLLELRREQATAVDERRYRELHVRPGESKGELLARHGVGPGPADPERVPYYLLLVGSPRSIPFRLQQQLAVTYAVGRLDLRTPADHGRYARAAVDAETSAPAGRPTAHLFATHHPDDPATELSTEALVGPLEQQLGSRLPAWEVTVHGGEAATAPTLRGLLGASTPPRLLVTATHGVGFPPGDPRRVGHQGALLCHGWPGPRAGAPVAREHYVTAEDLADDDDLSGTVAFHVACYGAGSPTTGRDASFSAALVQRMLSLPRGPALAVVGHVDRAWGWSFEWPAAGPQIEAVASSLLAVCAGRPVGHALDHLHHRYAELATELVDLLGSRREGRRVSDAAIAHAWTAMTDARDYALHGDPAVRLRAPAYQDGAGHAPP
ncbi:hypothetical protein [Cellulomonas wangsupingiae]|uniref:CHAT domain-containing protein n=1 Tax=Cellulomonas wangsupingiae TaxID=2968085 RepID=A0ABY5K738_9CELL|nr:hypothetical protein [Cellulomonas wangsupingiae]MCC2334774.1 hypothetical protein [Cellulomonas wangsupingiae]MCM0638507.1 hypothetical protein [Cellulomonas wangsupingiae]UUI66271.1 hypothetical protein NP075_06025 [Cellulomonas wangsupingiae]